ncbi:MAG: TonB-dependent receptor, partial [Alphaproteobacteria bacterium]|nr:TonB-dependent receptor [Alphaproteobacteria bacterium]
AFAALSAPVAIHAQDTTSGLSGQVLSDTDAPVAGARVSVVHTPSGTRDIVVTDKGGNFNVRGLRVGGPYTVTVDTKDYPQSVVDGIMLTLGDSFTLPIQLQPKEIVVTAAHLHGSHALITGSQTAFDREQIADIVSARRDVRDIVRRDILSSFNPQTGGVSIAGGNIRTQRFSIDGVQLQDSFGLNYGGLPSARGIVSIEAIEQLTVEAAPFDISEGNFQGGAVNVVLKSGTNRLHITAFGDWGGSGLTGKYTRANQGLVGDSYPVAATSILNFSDFGGSLTGPIIKDKLFFALSYEKLSEGTPNPYGVSGSSAANPVPNLFYNDTPVYGVSPSPLNATDAYPFSAANPTLPGLNTLFSNFTSKY